MPRGTVKWFNDAMGYGFIQPDNEDSSGQDVFVHYTDIEADGYRTLTQGTSVEYEKANGPKGPKATNVKIVN
jgi:CspA family cold shock protein